MASPFRPRRRRLTVRSCCGCLRSIFLPLNRHIVTRCRALARSSGYPIRRRAANTTFVGALGNALDLIYEAQKCGMIVSRLMAMSCRMMNGTYTSSRPIIRAISSCRSTLRAALTFCCRARYRCSQCRDSGVLWRSSVHEADR